MLHKFSRGLQDDFTGRFLCGKAAPPTCKPRRLVGKLEDSVEKIQTCRNVVEEESRNSDSTFGQELLSAQEHSFTHVIHTHMHQLGVCRMVRLFCTRFTHKNLFNVFWPPLKEFQPIVSGLSLKRVLI